MVNQSTTFPLDLTRTSSSCNNNNAVTFIVVTVIVSGVFNVSGKLIGTTACALVFECAVEKHARFTYSSKVNVSQYITK